MKIEEETTIIMEMSSEQFEHIRQGINICLKRMIEKGEYNTVLYRQIRKIFDPIDSYNQPRRYKQ
uniref:Uncharacterized protein n=1 Tax=viral metagenome TaxID=1070528 RepID=A0A6M3Y584_9ZZZZ